MFHSGAPKVQRAILNERAWARRPPGVQPAEAGGFRRKRAEEDPEFPEFLEFAEFVEFVANAGTPSWLFRAERSSRVYSSLT